MDCYDELKYLILVNFPTHSAEVVDRLSEDCLAIDDLNRNSKVLAITDVAKKINLASFHGISYLISPPCYDFKIVNLDKLFFEIDLLPNFALPARKVSFNIEENRPILRELFIYERKELSKINASKFLKFFRIPNDDEVGFRSAILDILECRFKSDHDDNYSDFFLHR